MTESKKEVKQGKQKTCNFHTEKRIFLEMLPDLRNSHGGSLVNHEIKLIISNLLFLPVNFLKNLIFKNKS